MLYLNLLNSLVLIILDAQGCPAISATLIDAFMVISIIGCWHMEMPLPINRRTNWLLCNQIRHHLSQKINDNKVCSECQLPILDRNNQVCPPYHVARHLNRSYL